MGAAGYVTIYDREAVEAAYAQANPGRAITEDWWYLDTITAEIGGRRYILDYADDQGMHEGSGNSFWFRTSDEDGPQGSEERRAIFIGDRQSAAQQRCLAALHAAYQAGEAPRVEVWT